jgi:hypothetical protein
MFWLYPLNSIAYLAAVIVILKYASRMSGIYKWGWALAVAVCLWYGAVYALTFAGFIPEISLSDYTRPYASIQPIQFAFLAIIFSELFRNRDKHG